MRPVSASSTMNSAAKASTCAGLSSFQVGPWAASNIWLRLVEPAVMATVKIASISAGSAMAAMVISRLLPMPAKGAGRIQPAQRQEEPPQRQQADEGQRAAEQAQRRRRVHQRHHQPGQQRGREQHIGHGPEDPGRVLGDDHVLAQELGQVEIRLPHARPAAVLQLGLPVPDAAAEQRRQQASSSERSASQRWLKRVAAFIARKTAAADSSVMKM